MNVSYFIPLIRLYSLTVARAFVYCTTASCFVVANSSMQGTASCIMSMLNGCQYHNGVFATNKTAYMGEFGIAYSGSSHGVVYRFAQSIKKRVAESSSRSLV